MTTTLRLRAATRPSWPDEVLPHLDTLLLEQAHLEKKAASTAVTCLFRYSEHGALLAPLSEIAREELEHFEQVLAMLARRGVRHGPIRPSPYASRLLDAVRATEPERLIDQLLCSAIIEARSCERMALLARALRGRDDELATMWGGLAASEARHRVRYVELAELVSDPATVQHRLAELLDHEASVVRGATGQPRLHD